MTGKYTCVVCHNEIGEEICSVALQYKLNINIIYTTIT